MNIKRNLCLLLFALGSVLAANAQKAAIKSNLLYDAATLTVNAGVEVGLAPRWTIDISGNYNGWLSFGNKWKHWLAQPEARFWFCDSFSKHFIGVHAIAGQFNFAMLKNNISLWGTDLTPLNDYRYQGWAYGAGIAYGYAIALAQHWNLELEIGAGYIYADYGKFRCWECGSNIDSGTHHYFGPTKAAVNLVYVF